MSLFGTFRYQRHTWRQNVVFGVAKSDTFSPPAPYMSAKRLFFVLHFFSFRVVCWYFSSFCCFTSVIGKHTKLAFFVIFSSFLWRFLVLIFSFFYFSLTFFCFCCSQIVQIVIGRAIRVPFLVVWVFFVFFL